MLKKITESKIFKNKLYLALIAGGLVLVIAAIVLLCVFSCGGDAADSRSRGGSSEESAKVQKPLFGFEAVLNEDSDAIEYPVRYISATDFYTLLEDENRFSVGERFEEHLGEYGATMHHVAEVRMEDGEVASSNTGMYLEKGGLVYGIRYTNCDFFKYDTDSDGDDELVFYTCELGSKAKNQICTYYILGTEDDEIYWCRYNRAWALGMSSEAEVTTSDVYGADLSKLNIEKDTVVVSLMLEGVEGKAFGYLACDNSGSEPVYYIEAGEYNDLLSRLDQSKN